jgi:type III secretion protein L
MTLFSLIYKGVVTKTSSNKVIPAKEFSQLLEIEDLVKEAQDDIKRLQEETQEECVQLKKAAGESGFQEGLVKFNAQLIYLDQKVKEMQHEMQKLILPLALKAAKKIVGEQLALNPETIIDIVMQALKPVRQSHEVKIYVSKEDQELLELHKNELKALFDHLRILTIHEREGVTKGSCIIETEAGIINASLDNQWRALEAAFENFLKH